ncbi:hypothetical protein [Nonomuraea sp. NPDC003754]
MPRIGYSLREPGPGACLGDRLAHPRLLIDALAGDGHDMVPLDQAARSPDKASDLPTISVLLLEWQPDPTTTHPTHHAPTHQRLQLQRDLLAHYTSRRATPTLLWDTSSALPKTHPLRRTRHVTVCDIGRRFGARRLLPPIPVPVLKAPDADTLASKPRRFTIGYVGDLDTRRHAGNTFLTPALRQFPHLVVGAGGAPAACRPPHAAASLCCRDVYSQSLATILLPPDHGTAGTEVLQQLAQVITAGCIPLIPMVLRPLDQFVTGRLLIDSKRTMLESLRWLSSIAQTAEHAALLGDCLDRLQRFRLTRQHAALQSIITPLLGLAHRRGSQPMYRRL